MKTSIVIPCMITDAHTEYLTRECIDRVRELSTGDYELVVVENNGGGEYDGERLFRYVDTHVYNLSNVGNTKAWDQGIGVSSGEYIILMNNDCFPLNGGWNDALVRRLAEPPVGICFPYSAVGHDVNIEDVDDKTEFKARKDGFCFAFRRDVYRRTGPFLTDQPFRFGYYEDDDFYCKVKLNLGLMMVATNGAKVWHKGQGTSRRIWDDEFAWGIEQNKLWYEEKWGGKYCFLDEK